MKPWPISSGALAALLLCSSWHQDPQGADRKSPSSQGALQRLDPAAESDDPGAMDDVFAREFDRTRWQQRLTQTDLDQREKSLEALLKRARLDPVARAFLEELAADPKGGELAWTARLALRELGRASFPFQGMLPGTDPFGATQRMQDLMNELFEQGGFGLRPPHPPGARVPGVHGMQGSGRSVQVEQNAQGAVVRITETIDGNENTRSYEGESLEAILAEHPELQQDLDGLRISVQPGSPLDLRFDLGGGRLPSFEDPFRTDERDERLPLAPQGKSRPIVTDRLGVVVHPLGSARARELGLEDQGLMVERTVAQTYAHLLGVGAGDVLLELDGNALRSPADIERVMSARSADDPLTLVWLDELGQRQEKTWKPGRAAADKKGKR